MSHSFALARSFAVLVSLPMFACNAVSENEDEIDLAVCEVPSDCALPSNDCCGTCGDLVPSQVTPVNVRLVDVHRRRVCGDGPTISCPPLACFPRSPKLVATCEAGRCVAVQLAAHPVTACTEDADCRVRAVACCECSAPTTPQDLIAVGDDEAFRSLVCDPDAACVACDRVYPAEATSVCYTHGCSVEDSRMMFR